ncbi:MAG: glycosylasparaginase, partial [Flavobacteriales bacterium]|nr:glycosylasparaginase [Flavobacteriales bacterium]
EGIARIVKNQNYKEMQIGYLAINKNGDYGAYAVHNGFDYALHQNGINKMINAQAFAK